MVVEKKKGGETPWCRSAPGDRQRDVADGQTLPEGL